MESFRSLVGMRTKEQASDETIFTEELKELLKPHVKAVMEELKEDFKSEILTNEDKVEALHNLLLRRFFSFAQTDKGLNKFMVPIMMYLRSARMKRGVK